MRSLASVAAALLVSFASPTFAQQWTPGTIEYEGRTIGTIKFRGNKKAEDDAIRVAIHSQPGEKLTGEQLRDDIRAVWKLGFFEDVQVEATEAGGKVDVTFVMREKPVIRKIYVSGAKEIG